MNKNKNAASSKALVASKKQSHAPKQSNKQSPLTSQKSAPAAVSGSIPKNSFTSYSIPGGMGLRGVENLGHFIPGTDAGLQLVKNLSVNPLNTTLFPRASVIARVFEQWSVKKLRFFFVPRAGTTNNTSILMYFEYDPADPPNTTDLQILQNKTRECEVVWRPCSMTVDVNEIHRNRKSFFVASSFAQDSEQLTVQLDPSVVRQDYAGALRVYSQGDGTATASLNHGYLFMEYDLQMFVLKPPSEVILSALPKCLAPGATELVVPTNSNKIIAYPLVQQSVGLQGGPNEGGAASLESLFQDAAGSIANVYDAAKQIYGAGAWVMNMFWNLAAAVTDEEFTDVSNCGLSSPFRRETALKVPSRAKVRGLREEEECTVVYTPNPPGPMDRAFHSSILARAKRGKSGYLAAGGFIIGLEGFDLMGHPVPANWPQTTNPAAEGLLYDADVSATWTYTGTGEQNVSQISFPVVPQGRQYVFRVYLATDAAAGSSRKVLYNTYSVRPSNSILVST